MADRDKSPADTSTGKTVRIEVGEKRGSDRLEAGTKYHLKFKRPPRWIEISLLDAEGQPRAEQAYALCGTDGVPFAEGRLDAEGKARVETVRGKTVQVRFPGLVDGDVLLEG